MKDNIRLEIELTLNQIKRKEQQVKEIQKKLQNLQEHLESIEKSLKTDFERIAKIGLKEARKDGKPETDELKAERLQYNRKLSQEKIDTFDLPLDGETEIWSAFNSCN